MHWLLGPQGDGLHGFGAGVTGSARHIENGSPINPLAHSQVGIWLRTEHWALIPQTPGHGSSHL